jgi:hypothetical protein
MIAHKINLVGEFKDLPTNHEKWWDEYRKGEKFALSIKKKNALPLKEIYKKMYEDGIHYLQLHFEGGHDEGGFDGDFVFLDKDKNPITIKDISKYSPTGWIDEYTPLEYTIDKGKDKITQVFEYQNTNYKDVKIDQNWLTNKWYEFGFLEEWGSFAFEGNVYGEVTVSTKDGSFKVDANETFESYESKDFEGKMFDD